MRLRVLHLWMSTAAGTAGRTWLNHFGTGERTVTVYLEIRSGPLQDSEWYEPAEGVQRPT